jgi:glycosyltransferase involved in cell wall biosynthesis
MLNQNIKTSIKRIIYLSSGNIPSLAANSMQVMKMSQSLSRFVSSFELVTVRKKFPFAKNKQDDYWSLYGISSPFSITQLPIFLNSKYHLASVLYAWLKRPDFVFTRSFFIAGYAMRLGLKVLVEAHEPELSERMSQLLANKKTKKFLVGIVTISTWLADFYQKKGVPKEKIIVLPDGVDLDQYKFKPSKKEARNSLNLNENARVVAYVGHLYENRGVEEIFTCASELPDILFMMVGGYMQDVERRREEARLLGIKNIIFVGFIPNSALPKYYSAADILLMPYSAKVHTASWMSPLKMFEYMAANKPIIASDLEAIRGVLIHKKNAILVPSDNAKALVDEIENLYADPVFMEKIATQACFDVNKYSWDLRAQQIINFIRITNR